MDSWPTREPKRVVWPVADSASLTVPGIVEALLLAHRSLVSRDLSGTAQEMHTTRCRGGLRPSAMAGSSKRLRLRLPSLPTSAP